VNPERVADVSLSYRGERERRKHKKGGKAQSMREDSRVAMKGGMWGEERKMLRKKNRPGDRGK